MLINRIHSPSYRHQWRSRNRRLVCDSSFEQSNPFSSYLKKRTVSCTPADSSRWFNLHYLPAAEIIAKLATRSSRRKDKGVHFRFSLSTLTDSLKADNLPTHLALLRDEVLQRIPRTYFWHRPPIVRKIPLQRILHERSASKVALQGSPNNWIGWQVPGGPYGWRRVPAHFTSVL